MSKGSPVFWVVAHGGAAHTRDLLAAGFSTYDIRSAVRRGDLHRVRRSWIVAPGTDAERRAAATLGARVTCVSGAGLLGIWTPEHGGVHVWLPHGSSVIAPPGIVIHRAVGPVPASRTAIVDPVANVLFHVARCLPPVDALAVWESALRRRMVDPDVLRGVQWRSSRAQQFAFRASQLSDSGLETVFVQIMRGMDVALRQQVWIDGHPVDGLIGDRLVVQIDGFAHHSGARDRRRDLAADARLRLRGYTVLRFDFHQLLFEPDFVRETVGMAIAQGLHRAPSAA